MACLAHGPAEGVPRARSRWIVRQRDIGGASQASEFDHDVDETDVLTVVEAARFLRIGRNQLYAAPKHPYTGALLSAVPIPNPELGRLIETIFKLDVPNPPRKDLVTADARPVSWTPQRVTRSILSRLR